MTRLAPDPQGLVRFGRRELQITGLGAVSRRRGVQPGAAQWVRADGVQSGQTVGQDAAHLLGTATEHQREERVSHEFVAASAVFDDDLLVSCAGLLPVMTPAAQTRLPQLSADKINIAAPRIASGVGQFLAEAGDGDRRDVRRCEAKPGHCVGTVNKISTCSRQLWGR